MRRTSTDASGELVAHLALDIAGRIVEFVGPYTSLTDTMGFSAWTAKECPTSHELMYPLSQYRYWAATSDASADDDQVSGWESSTNRTAPMFVASHAASHDPITHGTLVSELMNFTGAEASIIK